MENKLPYGLKDDKLVRIEDVSKGLACGCVCPGCRERLIARKGNVRVHHFAHDKGKECNTGFETAIHMIAKEILQEVKEIKVPEVKFEFLSMQFSWVINEPQVLSLADVTLEKKEGTIKPDVTAKVNGDDFFIEIYVTHRVDEEKMLKIKKMGISTIEIDLSKENQEFDPDSLKKTICDEIEQKQWLFNKEIADFKDRFKKVCEKNLLKTKYKEVHGCPQGHIRVVGDGKRWIEYEKCSKCQYYVDIEEENVYCAYWLNKVTTFDDFKLYENKKQLESIYPKNHYTHKKKHYINNKKLIANFNYKWSQAMKQRM